MTTSWSLSSFLCPRQCAPNVTTYHMSSVMLMVHSVMMMVSLLLGVMLGMVLAASVRRISMVNHVDAVARWLASPDLNYAALGDTHLLAAAAAATALMVTLMTRRQAGCAVTWRLPRHRRLDRRLFIVVPRWIFQCYVTLIIDVYGEGDAMMRHYLYGGADRRHRSGRIELHQGGLQLESVHLRKNTRSFSSLPTLLKLLRYRSFLSIVLRIVKATTNSLRWHFHGFSGFYRTNWKLHLK